MKAGHRGGLVAPHSLFVNVEPDALHHLEDNDDLPHPPTDLELTERALSLDPAFLNPYRHRVAGTRLGFTISVSIPGPSRCCRSSLRTSSNST